MISLLVVLAAAPHITSVQSAYEAYQKGGAAQVVKVLPGLIAKGKLSLRERARAQAVLAASLQSTGNFPEAKKTVDALLEANPDWQPEPGEFPALFTKLLEKRRAERTAKATEVAAAPTAPATLAPGTTPSTPPAPSSTPPVAAPPPGAVATEKLAKTPGPLLTRVAVLDPRAEGDASSGRAVTAYAQATTAELAKLAGLQVISMADIREMLGFERQRQILGCSDGASESCLTELAGSAGADELLTTQVSFVGKTVTVSVKRLSMRTGSALHSDTRTLERGTGEELLALVGVQVQALFPDHELKPGKSRGVDKETLARLIPPPLPRVVFFSLAGAAVAAGGAGALLGLQAQSSATAYSALATQAVVTPQPAGDLRRLETSTKQSAQLANALLVGAGALAAGAVGVSFFTNWSPAEAKASAALVPLSGGAALTVGGTF